MNVIEQGTASRPVLSALPEAFLPRPSVVFTDVDDTLTCKGLLPVETYEALYRLQQAGIQVIPVTGASAGWCDCMIKTWPVQHIIGENGAITLTKSSEGIVSTQFVKNNATVEDDLNRLMQLGAELSQRYPAIQLTQDQPFRLTDIAFDIGQTVTVDERTAEQATQWLRTQGVQARRSSIHINVWIGGHSKCTGAMQWLAVEGVSTADCLFIGDSPNDESMFEQFPVSVGVANIERFLANMTFVPTYITKHEGGYGFVDMATVLLADT